MKKHAIKFKIFSCNTVVWPFPNPTCIDTYTCKHVLLLNKSNLLLGTSMRIPQTGLYSVYSVSCISPCTIINVHKVISIPGPNNGSFHELSITLQWMLGVLHQQTRGAWTFCYTQIVNVHDGVPCV